MPPVSSAATELVAPRLAAGRACVLGLFAFRGRFETQLADQGGDMAEALQMILGATQWAEASGALQFATPTEEQLLRAAPSAWLDEALRAVARWHEESLGALLWALSLADARAYDTEFEAEALFRTLPFLSDSPFVTEPDMEPDRELSAMLDGVKLRDRAAIEAERERAQLWLWRARTTELVQQGQRPRAELEAVVRDTTKQAAQRGVIPAKDGDFAAFGKPFAELSAQEYVVASSIATARLRALNWLCRHSDDWDNVPLTT